MTARTRPLVTRVDVDLLAALARLGAVASAARALRLPRDTARFRLDRLAIAAGGPVVATRRGGRRHGGTDLTVLGWSILRTGPGREIRRGGRSKGGTLRGTYRARPYPQVDVGGGRSIAVGFTGRPGESIEVTIDPESILLATERFATSARNVLDATVTALRPAPPDLVRVELDLGGNRLAALVTRRAVDDLGLARGTAVVAYVKATAVRRVGASTRGSPRT